VNLPKAAIHPVNFWTSWRLSGGFILVMAINSTSRQLLDVNSTSGDHIPK
jgi:hypothetical protein